MGDRMTRVLTVAGIVTLLGLGGCTDAGHERVPVVKMAQAWAPKNLRQTDPCRALYATITRCGGGMARACGTDWNQQIVTATYQLVAQRCGA
jgi:hypothetical protein